MQSDLASAEVEIASTIPCGHSCSCSHKGHHPWLLTLHTYGQNRALHHIVTSNTLICEWALAKGCRITLLLLGKNDARATASVKNRTVEVSVLRSVIIMRRLFNFQVSPTFPPRLEALNTVSLTFGGAGTIPRGTCSKVSIPAFGGKQTIIRAWCSAGLASGAWLSWLPTRHFLPNSIVPLPTWQNICRARDVSGVRTPKRQGLFLPIFLPSLASPNAFLLCGWSRDFGRRPS